MAELKSEQYDVVVIGGSLGGAIASDFLGKAGKRVLLIDRERLPRQKACGEGLSTLGKRYLVQLGLWTDELESKAVPLFGYTIHLSNRRVVELKSRLSRIPQAYGISRTILDSTVYSSALEQSGVTGVQDRVLKLEKAECGYTKVTLGSGAVPFARSIIVASGGNGGAFLPRLEYKASEPQRYGLAFWCEGKWLDCIPETVQIFHRSEGQYVITPLAEGRVNVSVLLFKAQQECKERIKEQGLRLLRQSGFKASTVSDTKAAPAIHMARLQLGRRSPEAYLVGDALERFDPVGGMGMTHALFSGAEAAASILQFSEQPARALQLYYLRHEKGARVLRMLSSLSYRINVKSNRLLSSLIALNPNIALMVLKTLHTRFPAAPHLSSRSEKLTRLRGVFNEARQFSHLYLQEHKS